MTGFVNKELWNPQIEKKKRKKERKDKNENKESVWIFTIEWKLGREKNPKFSMVSLMTVSLKSLENFKGLGFVSFELLVNNITVVNLILVFLKIVAVFKISKIV